MNEISVKGTGAYELYEGDQILVGITHEISVGRDRSWVKYEATTKVRPAEPAEDARSRAIGHVNKSVEIATETVRNRRMR